MKYLYIIGWSRRVEGFRVSMITTGSWDVVDVHIPTSIANRSLQSPDILIVGGLLFPGNVALLTGHASVRYGRGTTCHVILLFTRFEPRIEATIL